MTLAILYRGDRPVAPVKYSIKPGENGDEIKAADLLVPEAGIYTLILQGKY
jgi:hypothetical protein